MIQVIQSPLIRHACLLGIVALVCCGCEKEKPATASAAGGTESPAPADDGAQGTPQAGVGIDEFPIPGGWLMTLIERAGERHLMMSPTASFVLGAGESLHPTIAPDGMRVEYTGEIVIPTAGRYRMVAEVVGGRGSLRIFDANGDEMSEQKAIRTPNRIETEWMALSDEVHTVMLSFEREGSAPARFRPMWEKQGTGAEGFVAETIPTGLVSVPTHATKDARRSILAMEGRVLLGELGCVACHATDEGTSHGVFERQAPLLGEIGQRASGTWIREWIADPQAAKPGAGMPDVFVENDDAEIEAITNYLVSLGGPMEFKAAATEENVLDEGRRLFHTKGCIACHGALESPKDVFGDAQLGAEIPEYDAPHPFGNLWGKWDPGELSEFLADPLRTHPAGRMPSLGLDSSEADLIATYLVSRVGTRPLEVSHVPTPFEFDPSQVETGRAAFATRGCANCHQIGNNQAPVEPAIAAQPLAAIVATKGPMDESDVTHIQYSLTDRQRAALRLAVDELQIGAPYESPIDDAYLRIGALGCTNCHTKDGQGGMADAIKPYFTTGGEAELGDEGRFPPHLSGVGFKLTSSWLREVLENEGRARPYLSAHMPQFGDTQVGPLVDTLARIDGVAPGSDETNPEVNDAMLTAGRTLAGEAGLNCISCHVFGDLPPAGTPGPDMTRFAERIRYAWWSDYVLNPPRFKPGTRMPLFYYTGQGTVTSVFNGDPHRQADALWAYFTLGDFMPPPEGVGDASGMALQVGDEPYIFRTFLKDAGSRAIAVGYPLGVHFAFDAERVRLVDAWKGSFIDASSAWTGRGGQDAGGQGSVIWSAPAGPALAFGDKPDQWPEAWEGVNFKGYARGEGGVPTFRYEVEQRGGEPIRIEETFQPTDAVNAAFKREFRISGHRGQTIWLNVGEHGAGGGVVGGQAIDVPPLLGAVPAGDGPVTISVEVRP